MRTAMPRLLAFYDDDEIGPDTCVVFTLEQAIRFHPYLIARQATPETLREFVTAGYLRATVLADQCFVSLTDLEAFVASGAFNYYGLRSGEFRCDHKLYWLLRLDEVGTVWAAP